MDLVDRDYWHISKPINVGNSQSNNNQTTGHCWAALLSFLCACLQSFFLRHIIARTYKVVLNYVRAKYQFSTMYILKHYSIIVTCYRSWSCQFGKYFVFRNNIMLYVQCVSLYISFKSNFSSIHGRHTRQCNDTLWHTLHLIVHVG